MCFSDCITAEWELQYNSETLKNLTNQEETLSFSPHKCLVECL